MKFKTNDKIITLVDRKNIKKGLTGYVVCDFVKPNEAYDVEFWNDNNSVPYGYETYLACELEKAK